MVPANLAVTQPSDRSSRALRHLRPFRLVQPEEASLSQRVLRSQPRAAPTSKMRRKKCFEAAHPGPQHLEDFLLLLQERSGDKPPCKAAGQGPRPRPPLWPFERRARRCCDTVCARAPGRTMTDGGRSSAKWFYECMPAPAIVAVAVGADCYFLFA